MILQLKFQHLTQFDVFPTVHHSIEIFHQPTLIYNCALKLVDEKNLRKCHHPQPTSRKSLRDNEHSIVSLCSVCVCILDQTTQQVDCSHAWACYAYDLLIKDKIRYLCWQEQWALCEFHDINITKCFPFTAFYSTI